MVGGSQRLLLALAIVVYSRSTKLYSFSHNNNTFCLSVNNYQSEEDGGDGIRFYGNYVILYSKDC